MVWEGLKEVLRQLSEGEFQALFLDTEDYSSEPGTTIADGGGAVLFRVVEGVRSSDGSGGNAGGSS